MSEPAPAKRGRKSDPIYGRLVELFLEGGSERVEIDYAAMGRKPDTVEHGLNAAIKRLDLGDTLRVSLLDGGEKVLLRLRTAGTGPSKSETTPPVAVRTSTAGLGVEGLVFENDFVSISWDEWSERFPLVMNPDGDEQWDYGNNAAEALLDQQDQLRIWTEANSGDGSGTFIASGRWRVNRLGYYVSTLPVPQHLKVQVWDDPWSEVEDFEFLKSAVAEWQQLAGVAADAIILDDFAEWWWKTYPRRDEIEREGYLNKLRDIGVEEHFDDLAHYRSVREMPAKGRPEPELEPFVVHIRGFLESGSKFWRLPESSMAPKDLVELANRAIGRLGVSDRVWTKVSRNRVWLSTQKQCAGHTSLDFMREESLWPRTAEVPSADVAVYDDGHWLAECRDVADWLLKQRLPTVDVKRAELGTRFPEFLTRRPAYAVQIVAEAIDGGVRLTRTGDWTTP